MITAKIIADSQDVEGSTRLTTFELTYPLFIHSEFMTHRCFSRNAASSLAIPIERMIQAVKDECAMPVHWGKNQKGMQAEEELDEYIKDHTEDIWKSASRGAIRMCNALNALGFNKQIANRLIEPFSHITVIATSEMQGLMNLFKQRLHPAAQPEFQELARRMAEAWVDGTPRILQASPRHGSRDKDWHIPYDRPNESGEIFHRLCAASAKCARVSFLTREEKSFNEDINLFKMLVANGHWSPLEHCAALLSDGLGVSNFGPNWYQFRHTYPQQCAKWDSVAGAVEAVKGRLGGKI